MKKQNEKTKEKQTKNENILGYYLKDINKIPLLTREEEKIIARKAANGNEKARETLINANLRFVVKIAKKYQGYGLPLPDLINEGNIGLMKAVNYFDADMGYHFITYAVWWVKSSILNAIAKNGKIIRIPLHWKNKMIQIEKTRQMIQDNTMLKNDLTDIAESMGMEIDKVKEIMMLGQDVISLDQPINERGGASAISEFLESDSQSSPEEQVFNSCLKEEIDKVLGTLNKRDANVIKARFGLKDGMPMTLEEIGDLYNISREGVRVIENKVIKSLQESSEISRLESFVA